MADYPGNSLKSGVKELLCTGAYSDLTIECRDTEFRVHKFALHCQSTYFKKLLAGNFKEGIGASNISRLQLDEDPDVFAVLVKHMYHFTYDDSSRGRALPGPFAVQVYAVADKYDIESLRKLAARRLQEVLDTQDVDLFIATIRAVEQSTADQTLWNIVIPVMKDDMSRLLKFEEFQQMMHEMPDLNFRLLNMLDASSEPVTGRSRRAELGSGSFDEENDDQSEDEEDRDSIRILPPLRSHLYGVGRRLGE